MVLTVVRMHSIQHEYNWRFQGKSLIYENIATSALYIDLESACDTIGLILYKELLRRERNFYKTMFKRQKSPRFIKR